MCSEVKIHKKAVKMCIRDRGKARPWMLYGYIGCAITLVGIFAIPMGMSEFAKYACCLLYTSRCV